MQDASVIWGGDLRASPVGDVLLAAGDAGAQQRILRRLLTNPGDYLWQPAYGAGLGRFVGSTVDVLAIRSAIRAQIFMEPAVARSPEPVIDVRQLGGDVLVQVRYVDAGGGGSQVLAFRLSS